MTTDDRFLLTFLVPLEARDRIVDRLLENQAVQGFTVTDSQGFSREHGSYGVEEQIAGFRRVCRFEILGDKEVLQALQQILHEEEELSATGAHWLLPVG